MHLFLESLLLGDAVVLLGTRLPQLRTAETYICGEAMLPAVNVLFQLPSGHSSDCLGEATEPTYQILELSVRNMGEQAGTVVSRARMCGVRAIGKRVQKLS